MHNSLAICEEPFRVHDLYKMARALTGKGHLSTLTLGIAFVPRSLPPLNILRATFLNMAFPHP